MKTTKPKMNWKDPTKDELRSEIITKESHKHGNMVVLLPSNQCLDIEEGIKNGTFDVKKDYFVLVEKNGKVARDIKSYALKNKLKYVIVRKDVARIDWVEDKDLKDFRKKHGNPKIDYMYIDTCGVFSFNSLPFFGYLAKAKKAGILSRNFTLWTNYSINIRVSQYMLKAVGNIQDLYYKSATEFKNNVNMDCFYEYAQNKQRINPSGFDSWVETHSTIENAVNTYSAQRILLNGLSHNIEAKSIWYKCKGKSTWMLLSKFSWKNGSVSNINLNDFNSKLWLLGQVDYVMKPSSSEQNGSFNRYFRNKGITNSFRELLVNSIKNKCHVENIKMQVESKTVDIDLTKSRSISAKKAWKTRRKNAKIKA
jgi:hypothetical protein